MQKVSMKISMFGHVVFAFKIDISLILCVCVHLFIEICVLHDDQSWCKVGSSFSGQNKIS